MHRNLLMLMLPWAVSFAAATATAPICPGSAPLGRFRVSVFRSDKSAGIPIKEINEVPRDARLVWEPVHLIAGFSQKSEVAALVVPRAQGKLVTLAPQPARARAEWAMPPAADVVALVLGPEGLNMAKVKSLVANNEDLLAQLADYAQQTSEVEALIQELADAEASGSGADAALRGFSSRYGVAMPKLSGTAGGSQQASALLTALVPTANTYDPLASNSSQMQQTGGLAASVAGLFFGNTVGLAAGGATLVTGLRAAMFPNTDFRSAFAQSADAGVLQFCSKNQAAKARTRTAYLWAYRLPATLLPVTALSGPGYVPAGAKSTLKLKTAEESNVKELARAREWRLVPVAGGAAVPVAVSSGSTPDSLALDLSKANAPAGNYRLMALWDWDPLSLGTVHVRPYSDFRGAAIEPASRDKLTQGSGKVTVRLTGADFEFVEKAELRKVAARPDQPAEARFELPLGPRRGEQTSLSVDIDTASAGEYKLLLAQADGVAHPIAVTVLPPAPKVTNLPVRVNLGETEARFRLEGSGLEPVEAVTSEAGAIAGAARSDAFSGTIRLRPDARAGQTFPLALKVRGWQQPIVLPEAIAVVGPRPRIVSAKRSLPADLGIEIAANELPAGASVGLAIAVEHLRDAGGARPQLELGCQTGELRKALTLAPDEHASGATLSFAGPDSLYLSLDPGSVGYPGCQLSATVMVEPRGRSDSLALGRVARFPLLDKFTLTGESLAANTYAGVLKGRDLDVIEMTGWDARNGLPVTGIPTPVPGDAVRQTLKIALPWPSPAPHAPLYIWLRGEKTGRRTAVAD